MAMMKFSTKRLMINKANGQVIAMMAGASVVVVFSLVASHALLSQRGYQGRVIEKKEAAVKQLKANVNAVNTLAAAYSAFQSQPFNVIGGNPKGTGDRDGDNAKIVLDALPSQYDFPALTTSLEKILTASQYKINAITGVDDEINQQKSPTSTAAVKPVDMPFEINVSSAYTASQDLVTTLQKSIRPFQIQSMGISGNDSDIKLDIKGKTFYQPQKGLTIRTESIK